MTSMAAMGNARPCFGEVLEKKNVAMAMVGPFFPLRRLKKRSFSVIASASTPPRSIDAVNGRKINNIGINGGEAPFLGKMNSESSVDAPFHAVLLGRFLEERFVYRQTFIIRSYEIGPDKTATMETLMNLLQVGS
jgi:fatty acyl-ACP thioesterase B